MQKNGFLYTGVYEDIKKKIISGEYAPGSKLPGAEGLMDEYNVSAITIKKALTQLKDEKLVRRVPGDGTYVCEKIPQKQKEGRETPGQDRFRTVGLVIEQVSPSFGLDLMYSLDAGLEEKGYKLITRFSYYDIGRESDEIEFLVKSGVSALIVMPCHGRYYNKAILQQIINGFPIALVDKKLEGLPVSSVRTDNKRAVKDLMHYLYDRGRRKVGFLTTNVEGTTSLLDRRAGFLEAAGELGIAAGPECMVGFDKKIIGHEPSETEIEVIEDYIKQNIGRLDSVICAEFSKVPVLKKALKNLGIDREKIEICCVDGVADTNVTYMKQDEVAIAKELIGIIFDKMKGNLSERDVEVPAILIDRS